VVCLGMFSFSEKFLKSKLITLSYLEFVVLIAVDFRTVDQRFEEIFCLHLPSWRLKWHVPPKCWEPLTRLFDVRSHEAPFVIMYFIWEKPMYFISFLDCWIFLGITFVGYTCMMAYLILLAKLYICVWM
jgi:hypothetical protein